MLFHDEDRRPVTRLVREHLRVYLQGVNPEISVDLTGTVRSGEQTDVDLTFDSPFPSEEGFTMAEIIETVLNMTDLQVVQHFEGVACHLLRMQTRADGDRIVHGPFLDYYPLPEYVIISDDPSFVVSLRDDFEALTQAASVALYSSSASEMRHFWYTDTDGMLKRVNFRDAHISVSSGNQAGYRVKGWYRLVEGSYNQVRSLNPWIHSIGLGDTSFIDLVDPVINHNDANLLLWVVDYRSSSTAAAITYYYLIAQIAPLHGVVLARMTSPESLGDFNVVRFVSNVTGNVLTSELPAFVPSPTFPTLAL